MIKSVKNKKKKGFTLVELIAVIAIIGILAAVIVPMVGKYTEKAKISKGTEQMREFVMAMETASSDVGKPLTATETGFNPAQAKASMTASPANDVSVAANTIVAFDDLTMIQGVSFANCKLVMNGTKTPTVGKVGGKDVLIVS